MPFGIFDDVDDDYCDICGEELCGCGACHDCEEDDEPAIQGGAFGYFTDETEDDETLDPVDDTYLELD
jgi:hypothetical protein